MAGFVSQGFGDFSTVFITEEELIRRYVGSMVWTWGSNGSGQLGDNTIVGKSSPVQTVQGGTNWKQVACGYSHTAAIKTDGTLWLWGWNSQGQLGDNTIVDKYSPVQTIVGGNNWKQLACGGFHSLAIKTDGTLWTWGINNAGHLGDNTIVGKSSPVQIAGGGTNWKQISCFNYGSAAIKTDGTLWTWGSNGDGTLGDNTIVAKSSPIQTIQGGTNWKQVACGFSHMAAIKTDGTLWTWGSNGDGQLGDSTNAAKSSPIQTAAGGTNWKQVACGTRFTSAIKTDGTLWTWGMNSAGQLGENTQFNRYSPAQTAAGGTNWKQVACGNGFTSAIKTDGTLWAWGSNGSGQLGDNTLVGKSSPVQTVQGGTNWKQVACSNHGAAISFTN